MMIDPANASTPRKARRLRRWSLRLFLLLIVLLVGAELFCRFSLGLGDPPLLQTDPEIEYLYQPSKVYQRFGNTIAINRWSMRSEDFPAKKSDPNEVRILLLGDSVAFGGTQTDQADIATEIIKRELPARLGGRRAVVGNISAGSWGAPNLLAYVHRYGLFDADVVIVLLSSHDWADAMTYEQLSAEAPQRKPILALEEALTRYLPRYLGSTPPDPPAPRPDSPQVRDSVGALRELLQLASESGAKTALAQHLERDERMERLKPGHDEMAQAARETGVDIIQLGPSFEQARQAGEQPYRDHIHPNQLGQRIIAKVLEDWIVAALRERTPPTQPAAAP